VVTLAEDGRPVQGPPAAPEYPALHVQAVAAVLSAGEPEFAGQLSHLAIPLPVVYVPATHLVHNPSRLEDPALHVQAMRVTLPAGESALAGKLLQLASPRVALYDPATHSVHVPPAKPEDPVLHVQAVRVMLPARTDRPSGHRLLLVPKVQTVRIDWAALTVGVPATCLVLARDTLCACSAVEARRARVARAVCLRVACLRCVGVGRAALAHVTCSTHRR